MRQLADWIKDLLWAFVFAGAVAAVLRFGLGLGATTGLNDASAWGLWIAFKLGFVALAGGGFTIAAMVYIFHLENYRPILRRAILLALLGYGSFIASLLLDLGLPWHIYMPIVSWQRHSVMFEIAWCVMLYFSVLVFEFGPVILEHPMLQQPLFQAIHRLLHRATLPLVILGIVLSTLHQSSLGALFLIMPHRVHPLWYSSVIPVLFFVSAIAAGLMALIVESFLADKLFGRGFRIDLLVRLGAIGSFTLWVYLGIRLLDLILRGVLPGVLDGSWQSQLFGIEILAGGILPATLLSIPKIRRSRAGLLTGALLAIGGVLSQRMSLSLFTMWRPESAPYVPAPLETILAFAIPAAAGLVYFLFSERLAVMEAYDTASMQDLSSSPQLEPGANQFREKGLRAVLAGRSALAVVVVALVVAWLPKNSVNGQTMAPDPVKAALGWSVLTIDGNRNEVEVRFPHVQHQERILETQPEVSLACQECHHLNKPGDEATPCSECHQEMSSAVSIFDHTLHEAALGGNAACRECHLGEHMAETAKPCGDCHDTMGTAINEGPFTPLAVGYQEAMHGKCLVCHTREAQEQKKPELAECATCHYQQDNFLELVSTQ